MLVRFVLDLTENDLPYKSISDYNALILYPCMIISLTIIAIARRITTKQQGIG